MALNVQHFLNTIAESLREASTSLTQNNEELAVARRLVDYLIIETSAAADAATNYYAAIGVLLPAIEQALLKVDSGEYSSIAELLPQLREDSSRADIDELPAFQTLVTEVQQALYSSEDKSLQALSLQLMSYDFDYANAWYSAGLELAEQTSDERGGGAANVRNYDEEALREFIVQSFPNDPKTTIVSSGFISGGQSKFTLGIGLSGTNTLPSNIILRGDASGQFSGADVAYEYRLQQVLHTFGVLVPKPLALEESGDVFGSRFMLSERVSGESIGHMFKMPEPNEKVLIEIAQNLAKTHAIPAEDFGPNIDNATRPTSAKVLEWLEIGSRDLSETGFRSSVFETAFAWLKDNAHINDQSRRVLVHGDYGLNNILIENSTVMAILDWEFAHIGNPAYDLGYFYHQSQALGSWPAFLQAYADAGQTLPDVQQLNYNILLAATRLGVQCIQVDCAFNAGVIGGSSVGRVVGNQYVNESIVRLNAALAEVL